MSFPAKRTSPCERCGFTIRVGDRIAYGKHDPCCPKFDAAGKPTRTCRACGHPIAKPLALCVLCRPAAPMTMEQRVIAEREMTAPPCECNGCWALARQRARDGA